MRARGAQVRLYRATIALNCRCSCPEFALGSGRMRANSFPPVRKHDTLCLLYTSCYSLGITDYIRRPFDSFIVQRRVKNTLTLYANQKRLMGMVSDQIYQNEKDSHVMIGILSHIVEFRNSESAQHVLQVQTVTEMLLRKLTEKTDVYGLTEDKIRLITTASALHDIGKIIIPENILNKAGARCV